MVAKVLHRRPHEACSFVLLECHQMVILTGTIHGCTVTATDICTQMAADLLLVAQKVWSLHSGALPLWAELTGTIPSQATLVGRR